MTRVNRISIQGFKSFAHKTEIPLEGKYNCILGPNGSGKSNIGDALCFVLGRLSAKSMRAEKAANLIFNGAKNKKPASAGTVQIAFSNQEKTFPIDEKEVVVERTITKKGNSIYKVNGKTKTRTEILDLLSLARINPDGYNIVLQGDITRFVTMPTMERRKIVEEISDVSIYEEKKHKAILELNKVEEKLNSAEIILKERGTYLKELKKDRDQALKFRDLKNKIDSLRATSLSYQISEREAEKAKLDAEIGKHQETITKAEERTLALKSKMEEHRQRTSAINKEIEQKGEKEQVRVHKEIEDLKVMIAKDRTRVSTLKDEINKIAQRKDQFNQEIKELQQKNTAFQQKQKEMQTQVQKKTKELQEIEERIAEFKKKNNIESSGEIERGIEEKDKAIEQKQEEIQQIRLKQQELLREKDRLEYQLQTIDEQIKKVKEVEEQNKDQVKKLQNFKTDFKAATLKLNQCLDHDASFASQLANARKKLSSIQEQHAQLNAKAITMRTGLSSNKALQSILANKKKFGGVYGTVAELGQVTKKYAEAVETSAGSRMQHLVVDTDKTAAECISYLKSNKLGSASFIPLNKIRAIEINTEDQKLLKTKGVHDFALHLVSFKPQFQKAFSYVFGNTLVVEDLDIARNVGIGRIKMATLDGNLAEASGVMHGGFTARRSTLSFQEKDSLAELEKLEEEISLTEGVLVTITTKREANEKEITFLRTKKAELEAEIITLEKTLHLKTGDLDASASLKKEIQERLSVVNTESASIQKEITRVNKDLATFKMEKQQFRDQISELRNPRLLAQLSAFEDSRQHCREEILRLESDVKNSAIHLGQLLGPEQLKIKEILKQHEKEEVAFTEEIKTLSERADQAEQELKVREKASKEFYAKYHQLFAEREKITADVTKLEQEVEAQREKSRGSEREVNLVSLKNAEIKAKLAGLQEELSRYKAVEILKDVPLHDIHREISKFEVMLAQMSAVNMKALEVYEQVEKEFNELIQKKEELSKEKTDVLTMMNEIETKKKDHFLKTFQRVNENFQRVFESLYTKGKAYLQLDNPDVPFEDGVSIQVKISGNRFMDLKSLSGGEKTLTALAFIFAIQEFQPATFYILDEIDAALDKHNSEKLAKLIKAYSDRAQYIVISHNDSLIAEADTLFGVSMVDGVSKVTSITI
ncbi:chromosome segregation protein SMC [Candidatus Woesearchaeota archaeon]|nr:chromosome segregation protein SMC [Candidatus Woesearchaeota archaeon]